MNYLSDLEDYTTDQLRAEIHRRQQADARGECWYCHQNLGAHTCKYSLSSGVPGWVVEPPRFVRTEDCMGRDEEYWQVDARNPVTGRCCGGTGLSAIEATATCLRNIRKN